MTNYTIGNLLCRSSFRQRKNGAHIPGAHWWRSPLLLCALRYCPHKQIRAHLHQVLGARLEIHCGYP
jgi:hypothetical protein